MLKILFTLLFMLKLSNSYRYLIILRHGESIWNKNQLYTGWANAGLSDQGIKEAIIAGKLINEYGILPTIAYSSKLQRSIDTTNIILKELKLDNKILHSQNWRLNERHYGKLTGYNRNNIKWSGEYFDLPPINLELLNNYTLFSEVNYEPKFGESHYMTSIRVNPIFKKLQQMINIKHIPIVCTHKNTARSIMKFIEKYPEKNINNIEVPNATPIIYKFDENMKILDKIILDYSDFPKYSFD